MRVAAQVLGHADPHFDLHEVAEACGVNTSRSATSTWIENDLRTQVGLYTQPGTWKFAPLTDVVTIDASEAYDAARTAPRSAGATSAPRSVAAHPTTCRRTASRANASL